MEGSVRQSPVWGCDRAAGPCRSAEQKLFTVTACARGKVLHTRTHFFLRHPAVPMLEAVPRTWACGGITHCSRWDLDSSASLLKDTASCGQKLGAQNTTETEAAVMSLKIAGLCGFWKSRCASAVCPTLGYVCVRTRMCAQITVISLNKP